VKATDELCTRTFAVHTLEVIPTKMPKFLDGGQTLPEGGYSPPKAPRGAALVYIMMVFTVVSNIV